MTGTGSKTYAGTFVYKPDGSYDNYLLGNGLTQTYIYDNSIRPQWMVTQKNGAASPVLRLNNTWDHNGNLTNVSQFNALSNGDAGSGQNLAYQYDNVNRLSTATETTGGTTNWSRTFNSDQHGNMWVGAASGAPLSAVTPTAQSAFSANNQLAGLAYDVAGNQATVGTSTGTYSITYDAENHAVTATDTVPGGQAIATYSYDALGRRATKVIGSGTEVYVYDVARQVAAEYNTTATSPVACGQICSGGS